MAKNSGLKVLGLIAIIGGIFYLANKDKANTAPPAPARPQPKPRPIPGTQSRTDTSSTTTQNQGIND